MADPLAALCDTWALTIQQRAYFEGGAAERYFKDRAPSAIEACRRIESEMEDLVRSISKDRDLVQDREKIRAWAAEHPLTDDWKGRESLVPYLASLTMGEDLGAWAQFGQLSEDVNDFALRLSLYNELLPDQARWQAEALMLDTGSVELIRELRALLPVLVASASQGADFLARADRLVDDRIAVVTNDVRREREQVLEYAEVARQDTLEVLRGELERMSARLVEERRAAIGDLEKIVAAQWPAIREDLPAVSARSITASHAELSALADRVLLRLALLGSALLAAAFVAGHLLVRAARRRAADQDMAAR